MIKTKVDTKKSSIFAKLLALPEGPNHDTCLEFKYYLPLDESRRKALLASFSQGFSQRLQK
ncbi:hypothetical protein RH915_02960 [Serpentinicella sp. ANB-PHB4]|uniref:hypothetical protein n=1 Tax=Serpentinicella sp. ANB-PHB4 TaxID=3074076 RepID=UPI00285A4F21|nr:hypothetical protein [Serpentinicella sp. ANB-PHB4]MDR5658442.1 hypothetical protein [Serpentinicella sp. ANB-PHB4]